MLRLKRPQYKSKRHAYASFFNNFMMPQIIASMGIYTVIWYRENGALSYEHAKQTIIFIAVVAITSLIYFWYKAFFAFFSIMKDDFGNNPETVICLSCQEPFSFEKVKNFKCPKCGGTLEDLEGFYERHPEFKNSEKIQDDSVQQQNRGDRE